MLVSCAHFYRYEDTQIPSGCFDTPIQVEGVIVSFPQRREGVGDSYYLSFDFEIRESIPRECGAGIRVRAYAHHEGEAPALKIGDSFVGQVRLRPPGSLWNRDNLPSNVYALANKTSASANVTDIRSIEPGSSLIAQLRYRLSESITHFVKYAEAERLLQGLLLGRQEALHPEDWLFLREFGIVLFCGQWCTYHGVLSMQNLPKPPRRLFVAS